MKRVISCKMNFMPDLDYGSTSQVYFARGADSGLIKIGYSVNPGKRASQLSSERHESVTMILTIPGGRDEESYLHRRFGAEREFGEWFRESGMLKEFLGRIGIAATEDEIRRRQRGMIAEPIAPIIYTSPSPGPAEPVHVGYVDAILARGQTDDFVATLKSKSVGCYNVYVDEDPPPRRRRFQMKLAIKELQPTDILVIPSYMHLPGGPRGARKIIKEVENYGAQVVTLTA